ncbi:MAG: SDR family oxidoreductase [Microvirga sp.]|nr:SDR family oxidoreductase [Microvirga sp.]
MRISGKVALITGASAGIGAASAALFARNGAKVALMDIDAANGSRQAATIVEAGGNAVFIETDVTNEGSVAAAVDQVEKTFGGIDILYNVAGGSSSNDGLVTEVDMSVWDLTMGVNVLGAILCSRHAIPRMIAAGGGAVVNMSSGAGRRGSSPKHIYTASKGAIDALTRGMAGAYARHNIRVNSICSGRILTERILRTVGRPGEPGPLKDLQDASGRVKEYPFWVGEPEDIANIALFLASDESRMITGASIAADGGRSAY